MSDEQRLYGINAVRAAFARRPQALRKLYLAEARIPQLQPLLKWCVANRIGYRVVADEDLRKLAASSHHEGVVADILREEPQALTTWLRELGDGPQCLLWLDGVGNPHNLGAILRSAAHFGIAAILLPKHSTLALLVVYLVLAAQFESFIHPLVIMLTVPLGVLGALIGLWVTGGTLNLFSQIGIVMLVGLAAKNGILIVEFANQLRDQGRNVREAVIESAGVRLRPILMTSIATMVGAVPLVAAGGPGSASRATIGVVIIFGVGFSTLLSLFVVPVFYALLAPYTRSPKALENQVRELDATVRPVEGEA